jgi:hypothetical protein
MRCQLNHRLAAVSILLLLLSQHSLAGEPGRAAVSLDIPDLAVADVKSDEPLCTRSGKTTAVLWDGGCIQAVLHATPRKLHPGLPDVSNTQALPTSWS